MSKVGEVFNPRQFFYGCSIPTSILRYKQLPPGSKLVWSLLVRFADASSVVSLSVNTIADELGLSARQVNYYVKILVLQGFVKSVHRSSTYYDYEFVRHPCFSEEVVEHS